MEEKENNSGIALIIGCIFAIGFAHNAQVKLFGALVSPHCGPDGNPIGGMFYFVPHLLLAAGSNILGAFSVYWSIKNMESNESGFIQGCYAILALLAAMATFISLRFWSISFVAESMCGGRWWF